MDSNLTISSGVAPWATPFAFALVEIAYVTPQLDHVLHAERDGYSRKRPRQDSNLRHTV